VVPLGINVDSSEEKEARSADAPITLGYLARICPEKGFHLLVEAFRILSADPKFKGRIRLRVAGWLGERDRAYFEKLSGGFEYVGEVDREGKNRFLRSLDILSVPTTYREPKGLFVLEALAHGVPVVQPRHGAFPEMLEATGGGLLVEPNSAEDLARGLAHLIADRELRTELGQRGREAVQQRFTDAVEAENALAVYRHVLSQQPRERASA
jgi:glycosyltransferase involved in cell wall biosynthesis